MSNLRRFVLVPVIALLAISAAAPLDAMRCETKSACPMMAKRAGLCHSARATGASQPGQMSAPMDCCRQVASVSPSSTVPAVARVAVELPGGVGAPDVAADAARSSDFRTNRQALGLFTLHAVWRI